MPVSAAPAKPAAKPGFAAAFEAFKKDSGDANREAVIKAARGAKKPESAEAERFEGRAEFAFKGAKDEAGFASAAAEYRKAADAAPWKAENYFNWGVAEEKAGNLAGAKRAFEWYLKADPGAQDAKETRKRIAGLEMGLEQANSPEGKEKAFWAKLEGGKYFLSEVGPGGSSWDTHYEIKDRRLTLTIDIHSMGSTLGLWGRTTPGRHVIDVMEFRDGCFSRSDGTWLYKVTPSADGKVLRRQSFFPDGREASGISEVPRS
jgi:tetratricopeptide (TPR) repeat protein